MAEVHPFYVSATGIRHDWIQDGDKFRIRSTQDVTPFLDRNKAMANHNDGYTADRTMRRVATIPDIIGLKWLNEEGWDWRHASFDPDVARKLVQKLNDPDWAYLRTAEGRVAVNGEGDIR